MSSHHGVSVQLQAIAPVQPQAILRRLHAATCCVAGDFRAVIFIHSVSRSGIPRLLVSSPGSNVELGGDHRGKMISRSYGVSRLMSVSRIDALWQSRWSFVAVLIALISVLFPDRSAFASETVLSCEIDYTYDTAEPYKSGKTTGSFVVSFREDAGKPRYLSADNMGPCSQLKINRFSRFMIDFTCSGRIGVSRHLYIVSISRITGKFQQYFTVGSSNKYLIHSGTCTPATPKF